MSASASKRFAIGSPNEASLLLQFGDTLALIEDVRFVALTRVQDFGDESAPNLRRQLLEQFACELLLFVERNAEAKPELRVVLKQRICPCRTASISIFRVRRGRQIAAVNRGASGRVGDDQPIAEELREQFDVRRLAATGARSGELKQRLLHLHFAHVISRNLAAIHFRNRKEEIPVGALGFAQRQLRLHVDGLQSRFGFVACRANIDADAAHPVQSSTATCSVYFNPFHSGNRASVDLNDEGAPGRTAASYALLRITACGQTNTHLPH